MGMTTDGLSYWQTESEGIELLDTTKEYQHIKEKP